MRATLPAAGPPLPAAAWSREVAAADGSAAPWWHSVQGSTAGYDRDAGFAKMVLPSFEDKGVPPARGTRPPHVAAHQPPAARRDGGGVAAAPPRPACAAPVPSSHLSGPTSLEPDLMFVTLLDMGYPEDAVREVTHVCQTTEQAVAALENRTDPQLLRAFQQEADRAALMLPQPPPQATPREEEGWLPVGRRGTGGGQPRANPARAAAPHAAAAPPPLSASVVALPLDVQSVLSSLLAARAVSPGDVDGDAAAALAAAPPGVGAEVVRCLGFVLQAGTRVHSVSGWILSAVATATRLHDSAAAAQGAGEVDEEGWPGYAAGLPPSVRASLLRLQDAGRLRICDVDLGAAAALAFAGEHVALELLGALEAQDRRRPPLRQISSFITARLRSPAPLARFPEAQWAQQAQPPARGAAAARVGGGRHGRGPPGPQPPAPPPAAPEPAAHAQARAEDEDEDLAFMLAACYR